ncbi:helix-turn-helix transcriptional regulator [Microbacterium halotolerans]|uniref:helix-turn-helix transcriptional regulator n=1 Tax=Microbacterium halotolerans TaxID=246613 RepID=UPI000E6AC3B9|nr:helix-turn-helix transcriptional regulator [Microbacterium halotolerans]
MPPADPQLRELGAFLRARRERVTPAVIGLATSGRRRTPGLRREEVAQLAGVGITWYTWLEQGRASGVSEQVIGAVARVLRMTDAEKHHALVLAGHAPVKQAPPMTLQPAHAAILEQMLPFPAAVQTDGYEIVASNRAYRFVFDDLDRYAPDDRNCAWLMFTDPVWRGSIVDESLVLPDIAARLRAHQAEHRDEPRWARLVERLIEHSDDFRRLWEDYDVADERPRLRRYRSPRVGVLNVHFQSLWLDQSSGSRMIVMSPADAPTRERLERLSSLVASAPAWTAREDVLADVAS